MKRILSIACILIITLALLSAYRANDDYNTHQTCVVSSPQGYLEDIRDLALSSNSDDVILAGDIFMTAQSITDRYPDGVFESFVPVDACFAEKLYIKAANSGNLEALNRLEQYYKCSNFNFGIADSKGSDLIKEVKNGELPGNKLVSRVNRWSYLPNPFKCTNLSRLHICQTPKKDRQVYNTKQAILCSSEWSK